MWYCHECLWFLISDVIPQDTIFGLSSRVRVAATDENWLHWWRYGTATSTREMHVNNPILTTADKTPTRVPVNCSTPNVELKITLTFLWCSRLATSPSLRSDRVRLRLLFFFFYLYAKISCHTNLVITHKLQNSFVQYQTKKHLLKCSKMLKKYRVFLVRVDSKLHATKQIWNSRSSSARELKRGVLRCRFQEVMSYSFTHRQWYPEQCVWRSSDCVNPQLE